MMRWSRPDVLNATRECSKLTSQATKTSTAAMKRTMKYCVSTPNRGLFLKPTGIWDGTREFEL